MDLGVSAALLDTNGHSMCFLQVQVIPRKKVPFHSWELLPSLGLPIRQGANLGGCLPISRPGVWGILRSPNTCLFEPV